MGGEQGPLSLSFRYAVSGKGEADAQLFMLVRPALSAAFYPPAYASRNHEATCIRLLSAEARLLMAGPSLRVSAPRQ